VLSALSDTATWVGSLGTWAVGVIAAVIAWIQYQHSRFRPRVLAYRDSDGRVVVRITNDGAGSGGIEDIDLLNQHDSNVPVIPFDFELPGAIRQAETPVPFTLPGLSTAQLVFKPKQASSITAATRARVMYGNGHRSPCVKITQVNGRIFGSTSVPGVEA
jgi:hypothetical protein